MMQLISFSLALAIGSASLTGCASVSRPTVAALDVAKAFVASEAAYDAALQTADTGIASFGLPVATVARIKALADAGHAYVLAGREAAAGADATDLATQTAALTALVAQIAALHVIASIRYSVDRSTQRSINPASNGPTMAPNCMTVMFSELAAASCSPGSMRGIAAERVGELMA